MKMFAPSSTAPEFISALAIEAAQVLKLQVATDRIAFDVSLQHLSVREEERYQRSIRRIHRMQQQDWLTGVLIPSTDNDRGTPQIHVYLLDETVAHKVGRLRNSMVTPVYGKLKEELDIRERVVPVDRKSVV